MIDGAPWFMIPLAAKLRRRGIKPLFSYKKPRIEAQLQPDGSIRKVEVFYHRGFVPTVFVDPPIWQRS